MKNLRISNSLVSAIAIFLAAIIIHGSMYFSPNIPEVGDYAANSILIQRAKLFQLFHGNYSRLEFYHPGPAFLQIQALGELILHDKIGLVSSQMGGQMIGALALNCVLIWLLFSSIENWAGLAKGALFNVTFLICLMTSLPGVVTGFWMPYLYVLPFSCYVYSLALLHLGKLQDIQDKFIFFLSLGLVIHGHASFIGLSFIGFLVSICSTSFTRHRNLQDITSAVASLAKPRSILLIPIVFMLPILIDACVNFPGEFPKYILFTKKVAHNDLVESIRYALKFFPRGPRMVPLFLGVIGFQHFLSHATISKTPQNINICIYKQSLKLSLTCFLLTFIIALIYSYRGIDGLNSVNQYTLYWTSGGYSLATAFLLSNLMILLAGRAKIARQMLARLSPLGLSASSAALLILTLTLLSPAGQGFGSRDPSVADLSEYISDLKKTQRLSVIKLNYKDHMQWPVVAGLLLDLERKGIASCTTWRHMAFLYTDKLTCPHGAEWDIKLLPVDQCHGNCSHTSGLTGIVEYHSAEN